MKTVFLALLLICSIYASNEFVLSKNNNEAAFLKRQLRQAPALSDSTSVEDPNEKSVESASTENTQANNVKRYKRAVQAVSDESIASPETDVSVEKNNDPKKQSIESPETESHEVVKSGKKA